MKRIIAALALITLAVCLLAACGVDTADVTLPPSSSPAASPEAEPTPSPTPNPDAQVLAECMSLIGMTDEESADALGGGEQNIAADGKLLWQPLLSFIIHLWEVCSNRQQQQFQGTGNQ